MTDNPFGEGFDMNALLQQAQAMQEQLMSAQAELAESTVDGTVGGGAVTVTVSGTGELKGVTVAVGSFDGADQESLADLGDMIIAAYQNAKSNADAMASEKLGPLSAAIGGGMGGGLDGGMDQLPGGGQPGSQGGNPLGFGLPEGPGSGV